MSNYDSAQAVSCMSGWDEMWPFLSQPPHTSSPQTVAWAPCSTSALAFCAELPGVCMPNLCVQGGCDRTHIQGGEPHLQAPRQIHHLKRETPQSSKFVPKTCLEWVGLLCHPLNWKVRGPAIKANWFAHLFMGNLHLSYLMAKPNTTSVWSIPAFILVISYI